MFVNEFMGMDFSEDGKAIVFHFLMEDHLAEEYAFATQEEATHFYLACLRFNEELEGMPVKEKRKIFREFLDRNILEMRYTKRLFH